MLKLYWSEGHIQIHTSNESWCRCILVQGDNSYNLGAEPLEYITQRLLHALEMEAINASDSSGEFLGNKVVWVLSLSEQHFSSYMSFDGDCKLLFWQDSAAKFISAIHLSKTRTTEWAGQLRAILA
jgi:hypothetical protein